MTDTFVEAPLVDGVEGSWRCRIHSDGRRVAYLLDLTGLNTVYCVESDPAGEMVNVVLDWRQLRSRFPRMQVPAMVLRWLMER